MSSDKSSDKMKKQDASLKVSQLIERLNENSALIEEKNEEIKRLRGQLRELRAEKADIDIEAIQLKVADDSDLQLEKLELQMYEQQQLASLEEGTHNLSDKRLRLERQIAALEETKHRLLLEAVQSAERIKRLESYHQQDRDKFRADRYDELIIKRNEQIADMSRTSSPSPPDEGAEGPGRQSERPAEVQRRAFVERVLPEPRAAQGHRG